MSEWYDKYMSINGKSYCEIADEMYGEIKTNLARKQSADSLISLVAIANNEEKRLSACFWSLSDLVTHHPIGILVLIIFLKIEPNIYIRMGLPYYNEMRQSLGFAWQCGLEHTKGKCYFCINPYGKIAFLHNRQAHPVTGCGTIGSQYLSQSFIQHVKILGKGISRVFFKKVYYEDREVHLEKSIL